MSAAAAHAAELADVAASLVEKDYLEGERLERYFQALLRRKVARLLALPKPIAPERCAEEFMLAAAEVCELVEDGALERSRAEDFLSKLYGALLPRTPSGLEPALVWAREHGFAHPRRIESNLVARHWEDRRRESARRWLLGLANEEAQP